MDSLRVPWLALATAVLMAPPALADGAPLASCGDVEAVLRARAVARMEAALDRNLALALGGRLCRYEGTATGRGGTTSMPSDGDRGGAARQTSTTNVQVPGVDEPDMVRNDDRFIYLLSGNQLLVLAAWPPESTRVLSATTLPSAPVSLFVDAGRAVVFSVAPAEALPLGAVGRLAAGTTVTVLDLTGKGGPRLERVLRANGTFLGARRVGATVHAALTLEDPPIPGLREWPEGVSPCAPVVDPVALWDSFAQLKGSNRLLIAQAPLAGSLPALVDLDVRPDGNVVELPSALEGCSGFHAPAGSNAPGFVTVLSFAMDRDDPAAASTLLGAAGTVYASASSMYLASLERGPLGRLGLWERPLDDASVVHAFALSAGGAKAAYRASGRVPGRLVNQFALDEHAGFLRVATTVGWLPDPQASNGVHVLDAATLQPVADLEGLAPGGDIRAVRFDGERAFVVTFKKTDPLWVLDLADPRRPQVQGALHIPGFSTYIHPLDATHLLTIGFDAADQGGFAWFTGIQLQLFDVSVLEAPALLFKESIGTRGTTSDATADHLAFNYFPARGLLALPLGICEGGDLAGGYGSVLTFNGLRVYRVSLAAGFQDLGGVDHRDPKDDVLAGCSNWWQSPDSAVKRSVFMEDFVTSISRRWLKVNGINRMALTLVAIPLQP